MKDDEKLIVVEKMRVHPLHVLAFIETFLFVLAAGFFAGKFFYESKTGQRNTITCLTERISEIGELVTLQYDYDAMERVSSSKAKWYGFEIPGTDDIVELKVSGRIKFGINLHDIVILADEDQNGNIKITLPKAKIVSHELNHKNADISMLKTSFLNNMQQSYGEVFREANGAFEKIKAEREKDIRVKECIESATENARKELSMLLKPLVPSEKSLQFEFVEYGNSK